MWTIQSENGKDLISEEFIKVGINEDEYAEMYDFWMKLFLNPDVDFLDKLDKLEKYVKEKNLDEEKSIKMFSLIVLAFAINSTMIATQESYKIFNCSCGQMELIQILFSLMNDRIYFSSLCKTNEGLCTIKKINSNLKCGDELLTEIECSIINNVISIILSLFFFTKVSGTPVLTSYPSFFKTLRSKNPPITLKLLAIVNYIISLDLFSVLMMVKKSSVHNHDHDNENENEENISKNRITNIEPDETIH